MKPRMPDPNPSMDERVQINSIPTPQRAEDDDMRMRPRMPDSIPRQDDLRSLPGSIPTQVELTKIPNRGEKTGKNVVHPSPNNREIFWILDNDVLERADIYLV